jgi:flagella basal body P-ring formation protein FlgA
VSLRAGEPSTNSVVNEVPATRQFAESDLRALLTETLQRDYVKERGELELRLTREWTAREVPNEELSLKVLDLPTAGVTPSFIVRFELRAGERSVGTWQMAVQARVWREVWVAKSGVKRGQTVADADVAMERRDVMTVREPLADFLAGDTTLEFADSVQSNGLLLARSIKLRPVIRRGQATDALVQDGGLSISMKVQALEDGAPGQIIRARNPISRRDVSGKVLNDSTILITL